ncbi:hypothetical protein [Vibrio gallaecicus]|nr:hypothetical protein [Vibrio gallaecicus]MDN3613199.1 hypothetical protein [Vibrio gallaecicus]
MSATKILTFNEVSIKFNSISVRDVNFALRIKKAAPTWHCFSS